MTINNLRLKCILFLHPQYQLEVDNLCGVDCLKGCTTNTTILISPKKTKIIKYGTECFELANELYQQVLQGGYVPVICKRKEIVYEGKNNRSYR